MKKFIKILLALVGASLGVVLMVLLRSAGVLGQMAEVWQIVLIVTGGLAGFILLYLLSERIIRSVESWINQTAFTMESFPLSELVLGTAGLVVGLIIAGLVSKPVQNLSIAYVGNAIGIIISIIIYLFFGMLGIQISLHHHDEIVHWFKQLRDDGQNRKKSQKEKKAAEEAKPEKTGGFSRRRGKNKGAAWETTAVAKILDTSVIIDGRIFSIIKSGFLEGPFIISRYVLEELQHIADSSDTVRRERGRKSLDKLKELQDDHSLQLVVDNQSIDSVKEVDEKLLVLTSKYKGKIVTTDYNLNKVAAVQGIPVLNVNELANQLKPVVIPGEKLRVDIIKQGQAAEQGIGYLEDGTMIVVENGSGHIGEAVITTVTSVYQTSAGKMIFCRI